MAALKYRLRGSTLIEVLISMSIISIVMVFTFLMLAIVAGSHLIALRISASNEMAGIQNSGVVRKDDPVVISRYEGYYIEHFTKCYNLDCNVKVLIIRAYSYNGRLLNETRRLIEAGRTLPYDNDDYEDDFFKEATCIYPD